MIAARMGDVEMTAFGTDLTAFFLVGNSPHSGFVCLQRRVKR